MIYYTKSSVRSADASDMIDRITLVYVLDQRLSYLKVEPRTLVPYDFFLRNLRTRRTKHYDRTPRDTARRLGPERMAIQRLPSQYHACEKTGRISRQLSMGRTDAR